MKAFLILLGLVLVCVVVGWITFSVNDGSTSVNIETERMQEDSERVFERGAEVVRDAGSAIEGAVDADNDAEPYEAEEEEPDVDVEATIDVDEKVEDDVIDEDDVAGRVIVPTEPVRKERNVE